MNYAIEKSLQNNDWIVITFVVIFCIIAFLRMKYPNRLLSLYKCLFSKTYFIDHSNELTESFSLFNTLLFVIQNATFALFFFFVSRKVGYLESWEDLDLFFTLFFSVTIYYTLHYLIGKLTSNLFEFNVLFENNFSYRKSIVLLFLPVLLFLYYAYPESEAMWLVAVIYLLTLLSIRLVLMIANNINLFTAKSFYFILYICTLELLPLYLVALFIVKNKM
jgi:hypothetical protein